MKKARWKKTIAAGAVLMSLGVVCPVVSLQAEEAEAPYEEVMEASDGEVNPCADQIGYIYRKHNGRIQKRRWNYTHKNKIVKKLSKSYCKFLCFFI